MFRVREYPKHTRNRREMTKTRIGKGYKNKIIKFVTGIYYMEKVRVSFLGVILFTPVTFLKRGVGSGVTGGVTGQSYP